MTHGPMHGIRLPSDRLPAPAAACEPCNSVFLKIAYRAGFFCPSLRNHQFCPHRIQTCHLRSWLMHCRIHRLICLLMLPLSSLCFYASACSTSHSFLKAHAMFPPEFITTLYIEDLLMSTFFRILR